MKQWQIDRALQRTRLKLARLQEKAALYRQINDIEKKLKMLDENKALYPVEQTA